MLRYFISAVVGYLLGSLSFAVIVSKSKYKKDIKALTKAEYDHVCNGLEGKK
mgnify:CR=1 FL=1